MRGTINRLVRAALTALETGEWPEVGEPPCDDEDIEAMLEACVAGLEARGCPVEISARPSWEGGAMPFCGLYDGDGPRIWVYGGLEPEEMCPVLLHEAAHYLDRGRANREFAACLAVAAASLELGLCDEPIAVRYLAGELGTAARAEFGRRLTVEEVYRRMRLLLGKALLDRAARIAEELAALVREGLERCGKLERQEGRD